MEVEKLTVTLSDGNYLSACLPYHIANQDRVSSRISKGSSGPSTNRISSCRQSPHGDASRVEGREVEVTFLMASVLSAVSHLTRMLLESGDEKSTVTLSEGMYLSQSSKIM